MKSFALGWLNSIGDAFAGGRIHWTPGVIALIVVVAVVLILRRVTRDPGEVQVVTSSGGIVLAVFAAGALVFALTRKTPAPAAPKAAPAPVVKVIRQTVRVAAPGPHITGWEIVVIVALCLVVCLVIGLNRRSD